jgi:isoquinoline 1-oxidoreductase beta subunit
MLVAAAAQQWNVDASSCRTDSGAVFSGTSRKLTYGQLVGAAAKLTPPAHVQLKDPKTYKLIGKPIKRLDTPEKLNGGAVFGIDVKLPGMLTAVIARPPIFGAKLKSFDDSRARSMPGVRKIVAIPAGVAVIADSFWQAKMARDVLRVDWEEGSMAAFSTSQMMRDFRERAKTQGTSVRKDGDAESALASSVKKIEAVYEAPYLSHLMMEPLNCAVVLRGLDRFAVSDGRSRERGQSRRAPQREGAAAHDFPGWRIWTPGESTVRFRGGSSTCGESGGRPGQSDLDARRRHVGRLVPSGVPACHRRRSRRQRQRGELEVAYRRAIHHAGNALRSHDGREKV